LAKVIAGSFLGYRSVFMSTSSNSCKRQEQWRVKWVQEIRVLPSRVSMPSVCWLAGAIAAAYLAYPPHNQHRRVQQSCVDSSSSNSKSAAMA
jgi:hypothetical protein